MDYLVEHIARVLEERREYVGMSKAELARRRDLTEKVIGSSLLGERCIKAQELVVICHCLGLPLDSLITPWLRRELEGRYPKYLG